MDSPSDGWTRAASGEAARTRPAGPHRKVHWGVQLVRDPELVSCAQRAASELERAWSEWRHARGLAEQVSESVASYVAHSIDHPWGRPRVVLGLDADEARALAALLGKEDPLR
ncbi:hypothetical protein GCM10009736_61180 [Actinomadura bangladeshensis]